VLHDLHWLAVRQRIKYKLAMTVYNCLHGLAPTYLADDCLAISVIAGKRHLRSARTGMLSVPRTTTTLGMRSFAVAGPVIWNSLPAALRTAALSPLTFARHLKAHLFGWSAARLRTIYDALYKSSHHDHHHLWVVAILLRFVLSCDYSIFGQNSDMTNIQVVLAVDGTSISGILNYTASICYVSSGSNANDSYIAINKMIYTVVLIGWLVAWFTHHTTCVISFELRTGHNIYCVGSW